MLEFNVFLRVLLCFKSFIKIVKISYIYYMIIIRVDLKLDLEREFGKYLNIWE